MSTFGHRVRQLRERKGWTQQELALSAQVRQETIARIETGAVQAPRVHVLVALAKALGTTTDFLCGMYEDKEDPAPAGLVAAR
jgi:transcriptional regulator with XRE-family HTH domain